MKGEILKPGQIAQREIHFMKPDDANLLRRCSKLARNQGWIEEPVSIDIVEEDLGIGGMSIPNAQVKLSGAEEDIQNVERLFGIVKRRKLKIVLIEVKGNQIKVDE